MPFVVVAILVLLGHPMVALFVALLYLAFS